MLPGQVVYIGLLLQFIGQISYIASIFRGHAKPNLVSWFIWMLAPMIGFFFLVQAGAGFSAITILFSIFIKNGYWKINAFDLYCGALALLALIFYVVTHNLGISIIFAMLSDSLAAVPTIVKSWKFPETESGLLFFLAMLSNILGLLTIKVWSFSISIFGIFVVIQCVLILFCIYRKKIFKF